MRSNFQRVAEKPGAVYQQLGLDYFMQTGIMQAKMYENAAKSLSAIETGNTSLLSPKDMEKVAEPVKDIDNRKEDLTNQLIDSESLLSDEFVGNLLKLRQHNKEINKEIEAGALANDRANKKIAMIDAATLQKGADVLYLSTLKEKSLAKWNGAISTPEVQGSEFTFDEEAPEQVDVEAEMDAILGKAANSIDKETGESVAASLELRPMADENGQPIMDIYGNPMMAYHTKKSIDKYSNAEALQGALTELNANLNNPDSKWSRYNSYVGRDKNALLAQSALMMSKYQKAEYRTGDDAWSPMTPQRPMAGNSGKSRAASYKAKRTALGKRTNSYVPSVTQAAPINGSNINQNPVAPTKPEYSSDSYKFYDAESQRTYLKQKADAEAKLSSNKESLRAQGRKHLEELENIKLSPEVQAKIDNKYRIDEQKYESNIAGLVFSPNMDNPSANTVNIVAELNSVLNPKGSGTSTSKYLNNLKSSPNKTVLMGAVAVLNKAVQDGKLPPTFDEDFKTENVSKDVKDALKTVRTILEKNYESYNKKFPKMVYTTPLVDTRYTETLDGEVVPDKKYAFDVGGTATSTINKASMEKVKNTIASRDLLIFNSDWTIAGDGAMAEDGEDLNGSNARKIVADAMGRNTSPKDKGDSRVGNLGLLQSGTDIASISNRFTKDSSPEDIKAFNEKFRRGIVYEFKDANGDIKYALIENKNIVGDKPLGYDVDVPIMPTEVDGTRKGITYLHNAIPTKAGDEVSFDIPYVTGQGKSEALPNATVKKMGDGRYKVNLLLPNGEVSDDSPRNYLTDRVAVESFFESYYTRLNNSRIKYINKLSLAQLNKEYEDLNN